MTYVPDGHEQHTQEEVTDLDVMEVTVYCSCGEHFYYQLEGFPPDESDDYFNGEDADL